MRSADRVVPQDEGEHVGGFAPTAAPAHPKVLNETLAAVPLDQFIDRPAPTTAAALADDAEDRRAGSAR